jgi:hypothetical protein
MSIKKTQPNTDSGQTTSDYVVGVSLFLFGVLFALSLSTTYIEPYNGTQDKTLTADRIGNQLVEGMLSQDETQDYIISQECASIFFQYSSGNSVPFNPDNCDIKDTQNLTDQFAVHDNTNMQIEFTEPGTGNTVNINGIEYKAGDSIPSKGDITTAQRYILMEDSYYRIEIRVW